MERRGGLTRPVGLILLGLLGAGCAAGGSDRQEETRPPDGLSVSVLQYTHDAAAHELAVEVSNDSDEEFRVESLQVRAPGFPGVGEVDFGTTVPPDRTFALRVPHGEPDCSQSAEGELRIALTFTDGGEPVPVATEEGADLLHRIHEQTCAAEEARAALPLEWAGTWTTSGRGTDAVARGTLLVGPVGDPSAELVGTEPTTLFQLTLTRRPAGLGEGDTARIPVVLRPTRCDPHAMADSSRGFLFEFRIRLTGSDRDAIVPVVPPSDAQDTLQDYWLERCGFPSGG